MVLQPAPMAALRRAAGMSVRLTGTKRNGRDEAREIPRERSQAAKEKAHATHGGPVAGKIKRKSWSPSPNSQH